MAPAKKATHSDSSSKPVSKKRNVRPGRTDYPSLEKDISLRLRHLRNVRGLEAEELGKAIGRSAKAIRSWEIAKNMPTAAMIRRLCEELECSADYLLGLSDERATLDSGSVIMDRELIEKVRHATRYNQTRSARKRAEAWRGYVVPKKPLVVTIQRWLELTTELEDKLADLEDLEDRDDARR